MFHSFLYCAKNTFHHADVFLADETSLSKILLCIFKAQGLFEMIYKQRTGGEAKTGDPVTMEAAHSDLSVIWI